MVRATTLMVGVVVAGIVCVAAWTMADETSAHPVEPPAAGASATAVSAPAASATAASATAASAVAHAAVFANDPSGASSRPSAFTPGDSPSPSLSPSLSPSPSPSPSDTTPPVTVAHGVDTRWHRKPVTITLTATDAGSGVASTWYQVDGGPLHQGTRIVVPAPANHSGDGSHVVSFFSLDNAGNREAPEQVTVKIDTTAPVLRWKGLSPSLVTTQKALTAHFAIREASGSVATKLRIFDQYGTLALRRAGPRCASGVGSLAVSLRADGRQLAPGLYRLRLVLTD